MCAILGIEVGNSSEVVCGMLATTIRVPARAILGLAWDVAVICEPPQTRKNQGDQAHTLMLSTTSLQFHVTTTTLASQRLRVWVLIKWE